jgi:lipopolysaccharide/colanic/teichoic acid biosynthesis glycosyltransferase
MALITAALLSIAAVLRAALSRQLADELKAWLPWVVQRVIQRAVARLHSTQRERYQEEWQSHVDEVPGQVGKLLVAIGFLKSARKMTLLANAPRTQVAASDLFKRYSDLAMSAALLLLFSPMMLVIAVALRLDGAESAFTAEMRVGVNGRRFKMYRFSASRRVGRFLWRTSLNEVPQLTNVLLGHMSLVGPMAFRPDVAERLSEAWPISSNRMVVRPGLTSIDRVVGDKQAVDEWGNPTGSLASQVAHDLFYTKHRSLKLDLSILWRSVRAVLAGKRAPGCRKP